MENHPGSSSDQIPQGSIKPAGQGWYARLTPQKKADYLQRQRIARQEKKVANHIGVSSVDTSHRSPESVTMSIHTPFSNITNTQTNGTNSPFDSLVEILYFAGCLNYCMCAYIKLCRCKEGYS